MAQDLNERYINVYTDFAFKRLFEQAEIAKFSRKELLEYEDSLKAYRDWFSVTQTAFNKGRAEGIAEGKAEGEAEKAKEIALNLISKGFPSDIIADSTGLSIEDIENMR